MKRLLKTISIVLIGALAPLPAFAQDAETCGLAEHPDLLEDVMLMMLGPWQVNHQSGYVVAGGMTMPFPNAGDNEIITMERAGDDLIATHPEMQQPMVFHLTKEPTWSFVAEDSERGVPAPTISSEDLELAFDCSMDSMPRLVGKVSFAQEGVMMDFTWRMVILDTKNMFAVQHVVGTGQGYPFFSRRTVYLHR